jgi:hypothetical protein
MSGGGSPSETNTDPWPPLQPFIMKGLEGAERDVLNRPTEFFPGSTVIPFAPETEMALGATANRAVGGDQYGLLPGAQAQQSQVISGEYLDPKTNPFFRDTMDAMGGDAWRDTASKFGGAGRSGRSPGAMEDFGRGFSRSAAPYMSQLYSQERGRQETAAARAPGLAAADYADINKLGQVGAAREGQAGAELQDVRSRYDFAQEEPTTRLAKYISLIGGNPGSSVSTSGGGVSPAAGALGGAATGAAVGSMFGPGPGTAIGAGVGGTAGLMAGK